MWRIIQVVLIGSICAAVFALLYGNTTPVAISFFGSGLAVGSLGSFLLIAFFIGLLSASLGALVLGLKQSLNTRRISARERRMRKAWTIFSDAQLSELLGEHAAARTKYQELLSTVPEADAVLAPLAREGLLDKENFSDTGSALIDFLHGQRAEKDRSYIRATEQYAKAYEQAKLPALLRLARDAAIKAELTDKATEFHKQLANITTPTEHDIEVEAQLAASGLPTNADERTPKLRDLVRRYPNCATLVEELAQIEDKSGKADQAALLLGRIARQNPSEARIAAFERQLFKLSLDRALSVIDTNSKADSAQAFLPTKLAVLIHHRALSAATELWGAIKDHSHPRLIKLGCALAILTERRDAAIEGLSAPSAADALLALDVNEAGRTKNVIGLAPQYSTP